jgi:hypothetical protein
VARGFESKDVEQQQQEMLERRAAAKAPVKTPEQIERERKREGLLLQRTRVVRDLEAARGERHRAQLEGGLKFLDDQLKALE